MSLSVDLSSVSSLRSVYALGGGVAQMHCVPVSYHIRRQGQPVTSDINSNHWLKWYLPHSYKVIFSLLNKYLVGETPWVFVNTFFFLSNVHLQVLASSVTVITLVFHYGWFSNSIISSTFASILLRKSFPSLSQWKNGQWSIFITGSSVHLTFSHLWALSSFLTQ